MSDSQPLLDHIGQKCCEMQLNELRGYRDNCALGEITLLRWLYSEAKKQPAEQWNINKDVQYFGDEPVIPGIYTPVHNRSHLHAFIDIKDDVFCAFDEREQEEGTEIPECAIFIKAADSAITKSVLETCHKISQHQPIEFFVLSLILSDLAILYRFVLQNVKKHFTPPLVGIEPRPLDYSSNILLSELLRHVLLRRSLNFCSCTT